jgi:hypothetical protein
MNSVGGSISENATSSFHTVCFGADIRSSVFMGVNGGIWLSEYSTMLKSRSIANGPVRMLRFTLRLLITVYPIEITTYHCDS